MQPHLFTYKLSLLPYCERIQMCQSPKEPTNVICGPAWEVCWPLNCSGCIYSAKRETNSESTT